MKRLQLCVSACASLLLACESIVGIVDRTFKADAGRGAKPPALCEDYCDAVDRGCPEQLYSDRDECLKVCANWPDGDRQDGTADDDDVLQRADSKYCRFNQADLAIVDPEHEDECANASPLGGEICVDPLADDPPCDNYCRLLGKVCSSAGTESSATSQETQTPSCTEQCSVLTVREDSLVGPLYNREEDQRGDTLQCRFVQLSRAAVDQDNCTAAQVTPNRGPDDDVPPCRQAIEEDAPSCDDYCRVMGVACVGANAVYEGEGGEENAQCQAACLVMDRGLRGDYDRAAATVGCRLAHAYNALLNQPEEHCPHAGPGGGGACPSSTTGPPSGCLGYCEQLETYCPAEFGAMDECIQECVRDFRDEQFLTDYNVQDAAVSRGLACRMLHVVRAGAASDEDTRTVECRKAGGADDCAPADGGVLE